MWFGTTSAGLRTWPSRRSSVTPMIISAVFPAPTSWASNAAGSLIARATGRDLVWSGAEGQGQAGQGQMASS